MSENILRLRGIRRSFGGEEVLKGVDIDVGRREFLTLLGPSGCGKTTLLRIIAGFIAPSEGSVEFDGKDITHVPPYKRQVNTVFQKYALFPHMNVFDNVAFGLTIKKLPKKEIAEKVRAMLKLVNLEGFEQRGIDSLSGGQQQRIAIARALVNQPDVLLLDEPLGALDLQLRKGMQLELKKIQTALGITFIYVTHDQEEALTMSDKVIVMNKGEIQQMGTPVDIYNEPRNRFVANFIGESNIMDGVMLDDFRVEFLGREVACVDKGFAKNEPIDVVIRPEDVKLSTSEGMFEGEVLSVVFKGVHYEMMIRSHGFDWMVHSTLMEPVGTRVYMSLGPDDIHIMKKETRHEEK